VSPALLPEIGNLAWAPCGAAGRADILDRFNGAPTLGVLRVDPTPHVFWRVAPYVGDVSVWLYVPASGADLARFAGDDGGDPLDGLVFRSPTARLVAIGVAQDNRVLLALPWRLGPDLEPHHVVRALMRFTAQALRAVLRQGPLPAHRQPAVRHACRAVSELAPPVLLLRPTP
jgi:hypothetical protein